MQTNSDGWVAIKRLRQEQKYVKVSGGREYVFVPNNGICLAWVHPDDVQKLLNLREGCGTCGNGKKKQSYWLADETIVRRWTYGGR